MRFRAFDTYCSAVCVMVRWKRYHAPITAELTAHMEDHADYLIAKGVEPDEAGRAAVIAMGDPYTVGKELDALHSPWYPRLTRIFTLAAAVLFLISALVRFNFDNRTYSYYPVFTPLATSEELLGEDVVRGRAMGGGTLGAYAFSDGAVALREYEEEDGSTTYVLELLLSAHTPWFWLGNPDLSYIPSRLDNAAYSYTNGGSPAYQGVFLRFCEARLSVEPPFQSSYTFEFGPNGEVSYTVTLEGVAAS